MFILYRNSKNIRTAEFHLISLCKNIIMLLLCIRDIFFLRASGAFSVRTSYFTYHHPPQPYLSLYLTYPHPPLPTYLTHPPSFTPVILPPFFTPVLNIKFLTESSAIPKSCRETYPTKLKML